APANRSHASACGVRAAGPTETIDTGASADQRRAACLPQASPFLNTQIEDITMTRKITLLSLSLMLAACGGGGGSSGGSDRDAGNEPTPKNVNISFSAVAGDQPFACGTTYTLGSADTDITLRDFRFYVHNVRLVTDSGDEVALTLTQNNWQNGDVAMLDFEDASGTCAGTAETNTTIQGTVPDDSKTFTGV